PTPVFSQGFDPDDPCFFDPTDPSCGPGAPPLDERTVMCWLELDDRLLARLNSLQSELDGCLFSAGILNAGGLGACLALTGGAGVVGCLASFGLTSGGAVDQ